MSAFSHTLPTLIFPSFPIAGGFLVRLEPNVKEQDSKATSSRLRLESKRLKAKWCVLQSHRHISPRRECVVDVSTFPSEKHDVQIPQAMFFTLLEKALLAQSPTRDAQSLAAILFASIQLYWKSSPASPKVDAVPREDGTIELMVETELFGQWPAKFTVILMPVAIETIEVLRMTLEDVQTDVTRLQEQVEAAKHRMALTIFVLLIYLIVVAAIAKHAGSSQ
ncbi:hypothetical protein AC1031_008773 [Aphanomyces cochlioides]|nr:hypothetical protein AC1031_008773 [Aphanomyces cochlioides]